MLAHCVAAHMAAGPSLPLPCRAASWSFPWCCRRTPAPRSREMSARRWLAGWLIIRSSARVIPAPRRLANGLHRASQRFGVRHNVLTVHSSGLAVTRQPRRPNANSHGAELVDCTRAAALVGRWLAATSPATAFALLGVRP
ncbi:three component ABC system middle component [Streptomyces lividans]